MAFLLIILLIKNMLNELITNRTGFFFSINTLMAHCIIRWSYLNRVLALAIHAHAILLLVYAVTICPLISADCCCAAPCFLLFKPIII